MAFINLKRASITTRLYATHVTMPFFITSGVIRAVVSGGGVKWISSLLEAEHILLLNEALLSLTMLAGSHEGK